MRSDWRIDRERLTGRGRVGPLPALLLVAGLLVVGVGAVWFFFLQGGETEESVVTSTPSETATVSTEAPTTPESTTSTPESSVVPTVPVAPGSIPVLPEEAAYSGEQARLVWLPGTKTGWLVDIGLGSAAPFTDVPAGARGEGTPVRDGSLIISVAGRVMRRTPDGAWMDLSPAADRTYRILDARTGFDHLHLYLLESGAGSERLLNVMYEYNAPDALIEKWAIEASGATRVGTSVATELVMVELAPSGPDSPPGYLLLSEETGRETRRSAFPQSDPPDRYVWGVEFAGGSNVFWMQCEAAPTFDQCGNSEGMIGNLGSGLVTPVREVYPGWSIEWEAIGETPSFSASYEGISLLVRTNVDLGDLATGDRVRLISARDL